MSTDRLTEILNFLSAVSRDIGAFRAETNARLGSFEARAGHIQTRLDGLEADRSGLRGDAILQLSHVGARVKHDCVVAVEPDGERPNVGAQSAHVGFEAIKPRVRLGAERVHIGAESADVAADGAQEIQYLGEAIRTHLNSPFAVRRLDCP